MYRVIGWFLVATMCCLVIRVEAGERVEHVAGGSGKEGGPAASARLDGPFGVDFDRAGNMYIVEISGHRVLKVDREGMLTRIAGTGEKGSDGDGGPALEAQFNGMHAVAVSPEGLIYVADTWNNRVRRIDPRAGRIEAFAGTGAKGYSGDGGPAVQAQFGGIYCVALDPDAKRLVLTDLDNRRIRVVDLAKGTVQTVAGNGEKGKPADGSDARTAPLVDPRAAIFDRQGNLYVLERGGHALRVVDEAGKIRTVIGDGKGDVTMKGPKHLALDSDGGILIADTENHRILKYDPRDGNTIVVAGSGTRGTEGVGGPPEAVQLNQPHGVTVHASGDLYITDSSNHRVLRMERK